MSDTRPTMTVRSRRWMVKTLAAGVAGLALAGPVHADTGQPGPGDPGLAAGKGQVPVAIRVPDAGIDAAVETRPLVDGHMEDPSGAWVAAWYDFSAHPGEVGNCVVAGHVDYWEIGPAVFADIAEVPKGALVEMLGRDGASYTYAVEEIQRIDVESTSVEELNAPDLIGETDYPAITLITCGGEYNGQEYTQRDIIRGRLESVTTS